MKKTTRKSVPTHGEMGLAKMFSIVTLMLLTVITGAWAQSTQTTTYSVALEEGTKDASNWIGKVGNGSFGTLPLNNVAEGAAVKLKYNGKRKVKSVTATTEASTGPVLVQSIELNYTGKMTIVGSNWLQIKTFRVLPTNATDKSVTWSVDGTHISIQGYFDDGSVRINGKTPGTGWVKATANDGSGVSVTLEVEFKLN